MLAAGNLMLVNRQYQSGYRCKRPRGLLLKICRVLIFHRIQKYGVNAMNSFFAEAADCCPWFASTMLAFESCEVIRLRFAAFANADAAADREARLMVSEKVDAMFEAGASLMAGATPATIIGRYRQHVADNTRRLSAV